LQAELESSSGYVKSTPASLSHRLRLEEQNRTLKIPSSHRLRLEEQNRTLKIPFFPCRLGSIFNAKWNYFLGVRAEII
jgi:hypothetical protein